MCLFICLCFCVSVWLSLLLRVSLSECVCVCECIYCYIFSVCLYLLLTLRLSISLAVSLSCLLPIHLSQYAYPYMLFSSKVNLQSLSLEYVENFEFNFFCELFRARSSKWCFLFLFTFLIFRTFSLSVRTMWEAVFLLRNRFFEFTCRRCKVRVLPPCGSQSQHHWHFTARHGHPQWGIGGFVRRRGGRGRMT